MTMLQNKAWSSAEQILRECLTIREKEEPDDWRTFNTKSMLGEALQGQKKYAEAEPLLLAGFNGMKSREEMISQPNRIRLVEAVERLVQYYEATGQTQDAERWRRELK